MPRTTTVRPLALLCLLLGLWMAAPAAHADATALTVSANRVGAGAAELSGSVVDAQGQPVAGVDLAISADGVELGTARTDREGRFKERVELPEDLRSRDLDISVAFDGRGTLEASRGTAALPRDDVATSPQAPTGASPNQPAPGGPTLAAQVDRAAARAGDVVTITGTIEAGQDALADAEITVELAGTALENATTYSDDSGAFTTLVEIPVAFPAGPAAITVRFAGDDEFGAAEQALGVTVQPAPATPSTEPTQAASQQVSASEEASTEALEAPRPAPTSQDGSPWTWFLIALVVVGGLALLLAGFLVFRGLNRTKDPTEDTIDILADPDFDGVTDPVLPDDGTVLSDEVSEPTQGLSSLDPAPAEPAPSAGTASGLDRTAPLPPAPARGHGNHQPLFRDELETETRAAPRRGIVED